MPISTTTTTAPTTAGTMTTTRTKTTTTREDDFILTLSDHEDHDGSFGAEVVEVERNSKSKKGVKRRRSRDENEHSDADDITGEDGDADGKLRGRKKRMKGRTKPSAGVWSGDHEEEKDQEQGDSIQQGHKTVDDAGEDDGALNPEFEFQLPGYVIVEDEDGFDAWTSRPRHGQSHGKSEVADVLNGAADVDEIIRRRRAAKADLSQDGGEEPESIPGHNSDGSPDEGMEDDEEEEDGIGEESFANFDDDDVLAPDEFGAGAVDEEEEHQNISERDGSSDDEDDDSEVASPTAHPDDVASTASESETSVEDPEEAAKRAAFFAPEPAESDVKKPNSSANATSFQSFSLSRPILRGLSTLHFASPTPIQRKTIPVALLGKDVVGSAVTGSGKTAAFLLPILERLLYRARKVPTTRVAILMPTRELAVQCHTVAIKLASFTDITFAQLVGGFSLREQEAVLKKRPDVVVATPGRFIDHMRNSASFNIVDTLEILVLDEADRMLQDGFAAELNEIIASIPKNRQTMLFSATMTEDLDSLIRVGLNKPVRLLIDRQASTVATLTQEFVRLRPGREGKRLAYLAYLCKKVHSSRAIIFFREKKTAHRIRIVFSLLDLKASELHGSMTQEQRISAVEAFRAGKTDFLLATDLASRGLDIRGVETVINFEAPATHDIYLHRVGRTARAGRSGRACTLAAEPDRKVVKAAVKAATAQGAKVISRAIDSHEADVWAKRLDELDEEVEEVLEEEKRERQLVQVEREVKRADNLIEHRDEIMARPRRTWFESEKEKKAGKTKEIDVGGERRSKKGGDESGKRDNEKEKKKKEKLSGKDKKRLDARRERMDGGARHGNGDGDGVAPRLWKKGKSDPAGGKGGSGAASKTGGKNTTRDKPKGRVRIQAGSRGRGGARGGARGRGRGRGKGKG